MDKKQADMLRELMEIDFCLLEINMYLDTHPYDERAIMMHNDFSKKSHQLEYEYSLKYGPLKNTMLSKCPYEYVKGPWPWEIDYCGCN